MAAFDFTKYSENRRKLQNNDFQFQSQQVDDPHVGEGDLQVLKEELQ